MTNIRHKINFSKYRNLLYTSAALLMLGLVAVGVNSVKTHNAYAESDTETIGSYDGSPVEASRGFSVYVPEVNALEITLPSRVVAIDVSPTPNTPDFESTSIDIKVGTMNTTGYTLTMTPIYNGEVTTVLTRTEALNGTTPTIATLPVKSGGYTATEFANGSDTVDKWGYMLEDSHLTTTNYLPVEAGAVTLNQYYSEVDNDPTTITLAAKVSSSTPAGQYETTLKFMAVTNAVTYKISYDSNGGSDVVFTDGMLESSATTTVKTSADTPARTGYNFGGWCTVMPAASGENPCTSAGGKVYGANSDIDISINEPDVTLYAIWNIGQFACTKQYRLQNADGSWGSYQNDTGEDVNFGETCTYSKTLADYKSENGANNSEVSTSGTVTADGVTLQLSLYRNTYAVTVNKDATYISSVSGAGTYRWGQKVTLGATATSNNEFTTWSQTSGTTVTYTDGTSASTNAAKFEMPKSAVTFYANGKSSKAYMQDFTKSMCQTNASSTNYTVYDKRDENSYTVRYINGNCWMTQNLRITGTIQGTYSNFSATSFNVQGGGDLTSGNTYDAARIHDSGNASNGVWYNYYAATAGTVSGSSNSTEASQDICPSGWRLPTYAETQTIGTGNNTYVSAFSPVTGGYYSSGSVNYTGYGYWWSSTAYGATGRRLLYYNGTGLGTGNSSRDSGFYIRCIRAS